MNNHVLSKFLQICLLKLLCSTTNIHTFKLIKYQFRQLEMRIYLSILCISLFVIYTSGLEYIQYQYRRTKSKESIFRNKLHKCSQECYRFDQIYQRSDCEYECVSESCYNSVYSKDPLEEGEVDIRLPHFKGCVLEEHTRSLKY